MTIPAQQDDVLSAIRQAESGGQNISTTLSNPDGTPSTASGYYQITNPTWQDNAPLVGVDLKQYPTAKDAPDAVQTKVAAHLLQTRGTEPWQSSQATWGPQLAKKGIQIAAGGPQQVTTDVPADFSTKWGLNSGAPATPANDDAAATNAFEGRWGIPSQPVAPATQPAAAAPQVGAPTASLAATPAPAPAVAAPPPPHIQIGMTPQEGTAMTAGEGQGLRDIGLTANRGAQWAANNVPLVGRAFNALGYDPTSEVNRLTAERGQFDQSYAGNPVAATGRVGTQIAASLPVMGGANALLAGAGRGIASGINALSPEVAGAVERGIGFIGGGAGAPTAVSAGSLPARVASQATAGALQGGETAAITSGQSDKPVGQQIAQGAATGAAMGAAIPAAQATSNAVSGATSSLSPETAQLAQLARDKYGIQLKAPQLGMSPTLSYVNSALKVVPGSGAGAENAAVQGQWQRAVAKTFGENADKLTPEVISRAQTRIGGVLNSVENNASIHLDNQFVNDAATIEANARSSLPDSEFGVVSRQLDNIMKNLQPGDTITGTTYGNLIHKGSPLDAALNSSDANISNYAGQIKEALRDSLTRSLPADEAQAYQTARTQYKSLKTVEPLTIRADTVGGARPSSGDISPAALRAAVNKSYGTSIAQAAPGQVPLNDLARIGQMMKEPPSSGTAERTSMLYAGLKGAELAGALAAGHYAGVMPAAATLGAGVVGGRLAGAYLRSNALANRMIGSSVNPLAYVGNPLLRRFAPPVAAVIGDQFNPLSASRQP